MLKKKKKKIIPEEEDQGFNKQATRTKKKKKRKKKRKDWQFEQAIIVFLPRGGGIGTCLPILVPRFLRGDPRTMTSYEAWQGDDTLASN